MNFGCRRKRKQKQTIPSKKLATLHSTTTLEYTVCNNCKHKRQLTTCNYTVTKYYDTIFDLAKDALYLIQTICTMQ